MRDDDKNNFKYKSNGKNNGNDENWFLHLECGRLVSFPSVSFGSQHYSGIYAGRFAGG
jgi:hypothetical protein